jgi:hypothetical protein
MHEACRGFGTLRALTELEDTHDKTISIANGFVVVPQAALLDLMMKKRSGLTSLAP